MCYIIGQKVLLLLVCAEWTYTMDSAVFAIGAVHHHANKNLVHLASVGGICHVAIQSLVDWCVYSKMCIFFKECLWQI